MSDDDIGTDLIAGTWTIDPAHSEVGFSVRHLMSKVRGSFSDLAGQITTTGAEPTASQVDVTIKTASVTTRNDQRDQHLRSSDILGTEEAPEMTFRSTSISGGPHGYLITGDLTLNGITRSVDLAAEFFGVDKDGYGMTRLGAEASTSINRKDFGIDFNVPLDGGRFLVGDRVDITLTVEAVLA